MTFKRKEQIGDCTLYLGDCLEVMPTLGTVDAVVTDPPYGIGHVHSGKARGKWGKANNRPIIGDSEPFDPALFLFVPCLFFGADHFCERLPSGGVMHVWDKECGRTNRDDSFSDAELFWTSNAGKRQVIRYMWKGLQVEEPTIDQRREHPTQKPVAVMVKCIKMMQGETILDPFMGSGTTGVACAKLGRKFIGIEIDEDYFNIACERIRKAYAQPDLFVAPPEKQIQKAML